ncbi:hypothetical protein N7519_008603 [Penicillium mononematosum]|uniref:uncharacterized protein n=1 Tax=Penicillium mononematosum TaxID=268346 RepID=UPI0025488A45|nr:uncharacterized protein N7519_008603 [Penicillium mononematosum]KAJ6178142.1 hypothetical protein N7519_008603 [Penicillium mononematosum]
MFLQPPFTPSEGLSKEELDSQASPVSSLQENHAATTIDHVPGFPSVALRQQDVKDFLLRELETPVLDELYDKLWLVARKSGLHIDALHAQKLKGRVVLLTEDPSLHLVWRHNQIYIKPIPICLLNHRFWTLYLCRKDVHSEALLPGFEAAVAAGFLRSYALLVRHHSDFLLAQELHLIPAEVKWGDWARFAHRFQNLSDEQVAKRYHYGQIRLSRLDCAVRAFRPSQARTAWFYNIPHWSITNYLSSATIPLLFVFASFSVVLSAMQVTLTVPTDTGFLHQLAVIGLSRMNLAFWVFSITVLMASASIWLLLLGTPIVVLGWQLWWGFRNRRAAQKSSDA